MQCQKNTKLLVIHST